MIMPKLPKDASKAEKKGVVAREMHKFKHGELHSGSKSGPIVKNRDQAIAIALSESGQSRKSRKSGRKSGRASGRK